MKTTNLFKAVAFVAMVIVSIMNSEVKAQDRFITNEEVQNDLIVAKTIFRQSGTYLYNHMRYEFTCNEITLSYARWNEKHQSYDNDVRKSVYEMNAENMPVAYKSNRIYHTVNLLTMAE